MSERITRKNKEKDYVENTKIDYVVWEEKDIINCINKLGQLEDIEEELGIDLIALFKALKNGVYHKVLRGTKYKTFYFDYVELRKDKEESWYLLVPTTAIMYIKDYGKTWALKMEELE